MKINDVNTKSFLGKTGTAENSYILINYAENDNTPPVTYKATIEELGKAMASKLKLTSIDSSGETVGLTPTQQNTYTKSYYSRTLNDGEYAFVKNIYNSPPWASVGDIQQSAFDIQSDINLSFDNKTMKGRVPVVLSGQGASTYKYGLYTLGDSSPVPVNLANPFALPPNDASIQWGKNVFVADDSDHLGQFYVMSSGQPYEISLGTSISVENTYHTASVVSSDHTANKDIRVPFVPIDSENELFNGIYVATADEYKPVNIAANLGSTFVLQDDDTLHAVLVNSVNKKLYYYNSSHKTWMPISDD